MITGPPELPGLIGALNWISGPGESSIGRMALTTPVVTESVRPSGAPTTATCWPVCTPFVAVANPSNAAFDVS